MIRTTAPSSRHMLRLVRDCPLFDRASRETRAELAKAATYELAQRGDVVVEQGSTTRELVLLPRGRVRLERNGGDGRHLTIGYRGSGDVLLEGGIARDGRARASAVAISESEVLRVEHAAARGLIGRDPGLAMAMLEAMVAQKAELEDRLESFVFRTVEARLAEFLLEAADRWGVKRKEGVMIAAPLTHLDIARSIGSTRETVTLTLGLLRRDKAILAIGRKLCIVDRAAMLERAQ